MTHGIRGEILETYALACKRCNAPVSYVVTFSDNRDEEFCDACLPEGALEKMPGWKEATQCLGTEPQP